MLKHPTKYYERNKDKAKELVAQQIFDEWTYEEICDYWHAIGYDTFFINSTVKPFFINAPKD